MKRSEMIEVMIKADRDISNCSSLYHMFSGILKGMEDAGMLPPTTVHEDIVLDEGVLELNVWEPEAGEN